MYLYRPVLFGYHNCTPLSDNAEYVSFDHKKYIKFFATKGIGYACHIIWPCKVMFLDSILIHVSVEEL